MNMISPREPSPRHGELEPARSSELSRAYMVELLYPAAPDLDGLSERLAERCPDADIESSGAGAISIFHVAHGEAGAPAPQTAILATEGDFDVNRCEAELQQTWDWPEAATVAAKARHALLVTEFMAPQLDHRARYGVFLETLRSVIELTGPSAIRWCPAGKLVDPAELARGAAFDRSRDFYAGLNVRLFKVENGQQEEVLMDTLGLGALGLPDLQVHFKDLDLNAVARLLANTAFYVFEQGDVIEDGQTVPGLEDDQCWRCRHAESLVPPHRQVLDLDPGAPFAAGRSR